MVKDGLVEGRAGVRIGEFEVSHCAAFRSFVKSGGEAIMWRDLVLSGTRDQVPMDGLKCPVRRLRRVVYHLQPSREPYTGMASHDREDGAGPSNGESSSKRQKTSNEQANGHSNSRLAFLGPVGTYGHQVCSTIWAVKSDGADRLVLRQQQDSPEPCSTSHQSFCLVRPSVVSSCARFRDNHSRRAQMSGTQTQSTSSCHWRTQ